MGEVALLLGQGGGVLHQIEHGPRVAVGRAGEEIEDVVVQRDGQGRRAALAEFQQFRASELAQPQDVQSRQELAGHAEGRVFRGRGDHGEIAGFQQRQEKVLLRLGEAVQFVEDEDVHAGELPPELLEARFRGAEAQDVAAAGARQQEGQRGLAAAGRAEQEQAREARALHERGQALGEVALSDEKSQFGRAQAFGQGL